MRVHVLGHVDLDERGFVAKHVGSEGLGEVRLAGSGWSEEDDVFLGVQEVELPEMLDDLFFDGALEGEVELLERLSGGEPCGFDP